MFCAFVVVCTAGILFFLAPRYSPRDKSFANQVNPLAVARSSTTLANEGEQSIPHPVPSRSLQSFRITSGFAGGEQPAVLQNERRSPPAELHPESPMPPPRGLPGDFAAQPHREHPPAEVGVVRREGRIRGSGIPSVAERSMFSVQGMPFVEVSGKNIVMTAALSFSADQTLRYDARADRILTGNVKKDATKQLDGEELLTLSTSIAKKGEGIFNAVSMCLCVLFLDGDGELLLTQRVCNVMSEDQLRRFPKTAVSYAKDQVPVSGEIMRNVMRYRLVYYESTGPLGATSAR